MALHSADGAINVTVVDGTANSGIFAADGSYNVFNATAVTTPVPAQHGSGALNVSFVRNRFIVPMYAANGSLNVSADDYSEAGQHVNVVTGLGAELVSNGTFNDATGWTLTAATVSGGTLNAAAVTGTIASFNMATLTEGSVYLVQYDIAAYTGGDVNIRFIGGVAVPGAARKTLGTHKEFLIAPASPTAIRFTGTAATLSIDNVSVKKVG